MKSNPNYLNYNPNDEASFKHQRSSYMYQFTRNSIHETLLTESLAAGHESRRYEYYNLISMFVKKVICMFGWKRYSEKSNFKAFFHKFLRNEKMRNLLITFRKKVRVIIIRTYKKLFNLIKPIPFLFRVFR